MRVYNNLYLIIYLFIYNFSLFICMCELKQIVSVLLVTAGAIMSVKNFENAFNNHHQRLGLALYGIIWLPALLGFFRPQR